MHSEGDIRKAVRLLLDKYGEINITEAKEMLKEVLEYDKEDEELSSSRNEIKILQRIGNIASHQLDDIKIYKEGFILDKTQEPAKFFALSGTGESKKKISETKIAERKRKAKLFKGRKIDWGVLREKNDDIGNMGEEFVLEFEQDRVSNFDPTLVTSVLHLSRLQGDGFGYDISSVNEDGTTRRIEVKTTTGGLNTPFFMSKNEKLFFETYKDDNVYLYRVYEFNKLTRRGKIEIIEATTLLSDYDFDPVSFIVAKKKC
ncbi:DUF3883 domain-containing protein [[Eubacterium] hominis]|uniref:DUF3883 domain-containing protein n=1 Tax=[Eubacterium] hominis TaxID=2764325 RepID=UPI003A4E1CA1